MAVELIKTDEAVGDEVTRRLALNTIAQGAETDIGERIYRGAKHPNVDVMPCTVLIEADPVPERGTVSANYAVAHRYIAFAYVKVPSAEPNAAPFAHKALRDLKRCMFRTDGKPSTTWGGRIREVEYLGREIAPRSPGEEFVGVAMEFAVAFVEDLANP